MKADDLERAKAQVQSERRWELQGEKHVELVLKTGEQIEEVSANGYDVARGRALLRVVELHLSESQTPLVLSLPSAYHSEGVGSVA